MKEKGLLTVDDYQAEKDKIMFYRDALLKELKKRDKSNNISNWMWMKVTCIFKCNSGKYHLNLAQ